MRFVRHVIAGLVLIAALLLGAVAFVLYDPLSKSPHWLRLSQMITAPAGDSAMSAPGEAPIQDTDPPWLAALALRYQPTLVVSGFDRFWPMSLSSMLDARWDGRGPCLYIGGRCHDRDPQLAAFDEPGSRLDYLRLPSPVDNAQDTFRAVAAQLGVSPTVLRAWPRELAGVDPFATAQIYFYHLAHTARREYPGLPPGLISLEYWFFYPLNYFPLVRIPLEALSSPIASTLGNTDYHQGDLEHVAVLLDPRTLQPRYLWMARHANEGEAYRWHSQAVQWSGDHAYVYAALGSHASYAHCGIQRRSRTYWFINDYVVCIPHQTYAFTFSATRLVDLSHTDWACWEGHFGQAGRGLNGGLVGFVPYETAGPFSPLLQQENFGTACHLAPGTTKPATAL